MATKVKAPKLNYSEIVEKIKVIHFGSNGWEYIVEDCPIYPTPSQQKKGIHDIRYKRDFAPKSLYGRDDSYYTKEEIKSRNQSMREANKELSQWKKGLRKLIKIAEKGPGAFEQMGNAVHGNGSKSIEDYFWRLYHTMRDENIRKMGKEDLNPCFTSYVDGSYIFEF